MKSQGAKKLSENKHDEMSPTKVIVVNSNSFVPQKNTKHEIGVIKMGSPSQIRRAVKLEAVNIEESEPSSKAEIGREPVGKFYQITEVPTTSFELKKPQTPKTANGQECKTKCRPGDRNETASPTLYGGME